MGSSAASFVAHRSKLTPAATEGKASGDRNSDQKARRRTRRLVHEQAAASTEPHVEGRKTREFVEGSTSDRYKAPRQRHLCCEGIVILARYLYFLGAALIRGG
jgi:hypothetical protein